MILTSTTCSRSSLRPEIRRSSRDIARACRARRSRQPPNYGQKFTPLNATTNIGGNAGIIITGLTGAIAGDPNIKPERQLEIEGGVDAVMKDQRAVVELTLYQRTINDLLLQRTLAPSTGFTAQFFNGGAMRNRGIEFAAQVIPIAKPFEWTTRAIFTLNRSDHRAAGADVRHLDRRFGAGLGAFRIEKGSRDNRHDRGDGTIAVVATRAGLPRRLGEHLQVQELRIDDADRLAAGPSVVNSHACSTTSVKSSDGRKGTAASTRSQR